MAQRRLQSGIWHTGCVSSIQGYSPVQRLYGMHTRSRTGSGSRGPSRMPGGNLRVIEKTYSIIVYEKGFGLATTWRSW